MAEIMEQNEIDKAREQLVVKANEVIQKNRYSLNSVEQKIVIYLISKIKPDDKEFSWYDFEIREFCKVCGIDYNNGKNYKDIKKVIENLHAKSFWVETEDGAETLCSWVNKAKLQKGSGKIRIRLDEDLHQYLLGLSSNFTQYYLLSILPMKSQYSSRIYELLKSYAWTGGHTFDIDELKRRLMCENYVRFPDFKRKVLDISVREINDFTDIEISWEPIKNGKRIALIKFSIKPRDGWEKAFADARAVEQLAGFSKSLPGQINMYDYQEGQKKQAKEDFIKAFEEADPASQQAFYDYMVKRKWIGAESESKILSLEKQMKEEQRKAKEAEKNALELKKQMDEIMNTD